MLLLALLVQFLLYYVDVGRRMALTSRLCGYLPAHYLGSGMHYGVNKVSNAHMWNAPIPRRFSRQRSWSAGSVKVVQTLKNDPFIKLSLSLCVIVLGGTLAFELYNKFKKKKTCSICLLPPTFSHHSIKRTALLGQLEDKLHEVRAKNNGRSVLYVTGPTGCGKTQLLYQYCNQFIASHQFKWFGLKRVSPVVLYLDGTSPDTLTLSLTEAAKEMGVGGVLPPEDNFSTIMSNLALKQVPWLLVVDNLTEKTKKTPSFTLLAKYMLNSALGTPCKGTVIVASQDLPTGNEAMLIPSRYHCRTVKAGSKYVALLE